MKKRITALALLLALALALAGCGKSEAVKNTEKLIGEIGTVTADSAAAVEAAEAAYNALSEEERGQVSNAAVLSAAREALDGALLDVLRRSLAGQWVTFVNVRDQVAEEMDAQFGGVEMRFADYLDACELELRLELNEDGTYRLTGDTTRMDETRQTVREAIASFVNDYLLFYIARTLEESGVKGDFSTRESIEAALGADLGEVIRSALGMDLETYIDQLAHETDPAKLLPGLEGRGRYTVTDGALYFSADPEKEPDGGSGVSFSRSGDMLTVSVPDGAGFPLKGTSVFSRAG